MSHVSLTVSLSSPRSSAVRQTHRPPWHQILSFASCMSDSCLQNLITVYCLLTTEKNSHQQCLTDYCLLFTDYCLLFTETTPNT